MIIGILALAGCKKSTACWYPFEGGHINLDNVTRISSEAQLLLWADEDIVEKQITGQMSIEEVLQEWERVKAEAAEEKRQYQELQSAGAKANIESRDQLIEQNELLRKQLTEQTEINQRLEHEFKMGAREAVITRKIAYWSLGVGIAGVVVAIIAIFVGVLV